MSEKEEQRTSKIVADDKGAESGFSDEEAPPAEETSDEPSKDDLSKDIAALGITDDVEPTKPEGNSTTTQPKAENTKPNPNDETTTPRLVTYISLHNDVRLLPTHSQVTIPTDR